MSSWRFSILPKCGSAHPSLRVGPMPPIVQARGIRHRTVPCPTRTGRPTAATGRSISRSPQAPMFCYSWRRRYPRTGLRRVSFRYAPPAKNRDGGQLVEVEVVVNGQSVGRIVYSHVVTSLEGGEIDRWGGRIGSVFSTTKRDPKCWMGSHVHMEMKNVHNRSCFNRGWRPGQRIEKTNFIGFLGGRRATKPQTACP